MNNIYLYLIPVIVYFVFVVLMQLIGVFSKRKQADECNNYAIIIAVRNEELFLEKCINSILNQKHMPEAIIIADDHSSDESLTIARRFASDYPELITCFRVQGQGKMDAVAEALALVQTEWVLSTDADCIVGPRWADVMTRTGCKTKLQCGPVAIIRERPLSMLQSAEMHFIVAGGALMNRAGLPIQASGANMFFSRQDMLDYIANRSPKIQSGDDVFFLQYLMAKYGSEAVAFCNHKDSLVKTRAESGLRNWIKQRLRWIAKARSYTSWLPFLPGTILFVSNTAYVLAIIAFFMTNHVCFAMVPFLKWLTDVWLSMSYSVCWKAKVHPLAVLFMSVVYPLWIVLLITVNIFTRKHRWKQRPL